MIGTLVLVLMIPGLVLLIYIVGAKALEGTKLAVHWAAEGKCVHCGYDLTVSPLRCPECGTMVAVRFSILDPDDLITFEKAYTIYHQSIELSTQKPRDIMLQMLRRSDYRFVLVWQHGQVAGVAVLFIAATAGFSLLEYLAVRSELRGLGLGSELFQETSRIAASAQGPMPGPMLIEVDSAEIPATGDGDVSDASHVPPAHEPGEGANDPSEARRPNVATDPHDAIGSGSENDAGKDSQPPSEAVRRQAFYRRLGCRRIAGLRYLLPLHADGSAPAMDLLAFRPPAAVTRDELGEWLSIIYSRVYGRPRDDPRISAMLRSTGEPVRLD